MKVLRCLFQLYSSAELGSRSSAIPHTLHFISIVLKLLKIFPTDYIKIAERFFGDPVRCVTPAKSQQRSLHENRAGS
ncbi:hypothetical protein Q7C36_013934 [Tachysurus vachellii]|uniref:Uncharacterized protein n=1 Tax=Tachysurus vachellii TaxID=175792 RepID=A0AA88MJK1_TACVA|nr:hypothetical protein Q7C36_013934 [Tachysurus vachellii]